jgi:hypothetical protein
MVVSRLPSLHTLGRETRVPVDYQLGCHCPIHDVGGTVRVLEDSIEDIRGWVYTRIKHAFSPVAPIGLLEDMNDLGILGTYHLLIADKVLSDPKRWGAFFDQRRQLGLRDYIMMDNSLIELGHPLRAPDLIRAVEIVHANTIVLPDSYGNMQETVERSINGAYEMWDDLPDYCSFQYVVQGTTLPEAMEGVEFLKRYVPKQNGTVLERVSHLSVPRVFCDRTGTRKALIQTLYSHYGLPVHLLGFSENINDDVASTQMRGVTGIDSAMPLWAGQQQYVLDGTPNNPVASKHRPRDYWTWGNGDLSPEMIVNMFRVNQWLGNTL